MSILNEVLSLNAQESVSVPSGLRYLTSPQ